MKGSLENHIDQFINSADPEQFVDDLFVTLQDKLSPGSLRIVKFMYLSGMYQFSVLNKKHSDECFFGPSPEASTYGPKQ